MTQVRSGADVFGGNKKMKFSSSKAGTLTALAILLGASPAFGQNSAYYSMIVDGYDDDKDPKLTSVPRLIFVAATGKSSRPETRRGAHCLIASRSSVYCMLLKKWCALIALYRERKKSTCSWP